MKTCGAALAEMPMPMTSAVLEAMLYKNVSQLLNTKHVTCECDMYEPGGEISLDDDEFVTVGIIFDFRLDVAPLDLSTQPNTQLLD